MPINTISRHASLRAGQRNVSARDVTLVMDLGDKIHNGDAIFYFLGKRNIPNEYKSYDSISKLEGTTLVISKDGTCLITLYKNKKGLRNLRKKRKWTLSNNKTTCAIKH